MSAFNINGQGNTYFLKLLISPELHTLQQQISQILLLKYQANKCSLTFFHFILRIFTLCQLISRQAERGEDIGPLMTLNFNYQSLEFILVFQALYFKKCKGKSHFNFIFYLFIF